MGIAILSNGFRCMNKSRPVLGDRPLILAEMGQAHDGSFMMAQSYLDLAAQSGADGIKVQIHFAEEESTHDEPFRVGSVAPDASRLDFWRRTSFTPDQWRTLHSQALDLGILFIPSVFSLKALDMVADMNVDAIKVGSAECLQNWFLDAVREKRLPTILSSGLSTWSDVGASIDRVSGHVPFIAILQCTSAYPTPIELAGANLIPYMQGRFGVPVGLSDHTGSTSPSILALSLGASLIEVHATLTKSIRGLDSSSSVTFEQLKQIVEFKTDLVAMNGGVFDKDKVAAELSSLRHIFGRSLALREPLEQGVRIEKWHLTFKKPGGGISPEDIDSVIGLRTASPVPSDRLLSWQDVE